MTIPCKITFRNLPPSEAIENHIREQVAKLESFYSRIMSCRVIVESPHRHHQKGKAYQVRIDLTVPGGEIVINRAHKSLSPVKLREARENENNLVESHQFTKQSAHADIYVAIRDALNAAGRKLQDYARRQSRAVKLHEFPAAARIARLFPEERYGFLETQDGREIYFHANSVLAPRFDHLHVGAEVYFAEEQGEKGPQASSVRGAGRLVKTRIIGVE
jgi:cold shock CspA family protein/ribosome-associated translation inhibitor RaiA